ncbi:MAG: MFS transporter, partial [bacterium]|nr:MFS transporter [bacterium]
GIGIMPTYSMVGVIAPIAIIFFRIIQGFSIGGEIPGAITYISESFTEYKGFACGLIFCAILFGIVMGSLAHALIVTLFLEPQIQAYAWRIPFIIGGILGLISCVLRKELHESTQFLQMEHLIEKFPLLVVVKEQSILTIAGALITALCAVVVTALFLFNPVYFKEVLNLSANAYAWERTLSITLGALLTVLVGYMTDIIAAPKLVLIAALTGIVFAYPIFLIYCYYPNMYHLAFLASAILLGLSAGSIPRLLSELFPTQIRYSAIAVSYNLGFAIFGGLTPFISLSLIYSTGVKTIPAVYIMCISLLVLMSLYVLHKSKLNGVTNNNSLANEPLQIV